MSGQASDVPSVFCSITEVHFEEHFCRLTFGELINRPGQQAPKIEWRVSVTVPKERAMELSKLIRETYAKATPLQVVR